MASAKDYANWIVNNEDKKGTPEFDTVVEAYQKAKQMEASVEEVRASTYAEKPALAIASEAFGNIPSSAYNLGKSVVEAVAHPLDTANALTQLGAGALQIAADKLGGKELVDKIGRDEKSIQMAEAVGKFYADRYGSIEGAKQAIAKDPVGVLADISMALKAGQIATMPAKLGGATAGKVPTTLGKIADTVEPIALTANALKAVPTAVSEALGGMTGTGGLPIREGYKAGVEGGAKSEAFTGNMRGIADPMQVVENFKANLNAFRDKRNAQYTQLMGQHVNPDPTILSFQGIDKAITDALGRVTYKGKITDETAANALNKAWSVIDDWRNSDPAQYHTPEGFDKLKQKIGSIVDGLPVEQKNARQAINDLYNAIKSDIVKQAPEYGKIMKGYSDASDLIRQIEQSLSMGNKAAADTQLRKLTGVMRNNVNTNYGARTKLVEMLEGQPYEVMPALAGQAMSANMPRGIQGATQPLAAIGLGYGSNPLLGVGLAAASSPRLIGEVSHAAGQVTRPIVKGARMGIEQVDKIIASVPQLQYLKFVKDPEMRLALFMQAQSEAAQAENQ